MPQNIQFTLCVLFMWYVHLSSISLEHSSYPQLVNSECDGKKIKYTVITVNITQTAQNFNTELMQMGRANGRAHEP
jgi:hypothetical protein